MASRKSGPNKIITVDQPSAPWKSDPEFKKLQRKWEKILQKEGLSAQPSYFARPHSREVEMPAGVRDEDGCQLPSPDFTTSLWDSSDIYQFNRAAISHRFPSRTDNTLWLLRHRDGLSIRKIVIRLHHRITFYQAQKRLALLTTEFKYWIRHGCYTHPKALTP